MLCVTLDADGLSWKYVPGKGNLSSAVTRVRQTAQLGAVWPPGADRLTPAFSWPFVSVSLSALSPADQCEARGRLRAHGNGLPMGRVGSGAVSLTCRVPRGMGAQREQWLLPEDLQSMFSAHSRPPSGSLMLLS